LQHIILWLPQAIAPFQLQPFVNHLTSMQLIPDATKIVILQPYIGVGKGLIASGATSYMHRWMAGGDPVPATSVTSGAPAISPSIHCGLTSTVT
jgi:hypothetical protein